MSVGRRPIFAANWKMNLDGDAIRDFMLDILPVARKTEAEIIIFPPAVYLTQVCSLAAGSPIEVGAQNMFWEKAGAYTGEISAPMLTDCGAGFVLCGHSERRHIFGESPEMVTRKARAALQAGLIPMICVGETLDQREAGETLEVLKDDLICSLSAIEPDPTVIIAYEPVWAIGTGRVAMPADAEEAIAHLRQVLRDIWGDTADQVRILYGGSVKPENIAELMACPNIDGGLIGGASLKAASFAEIIDNGKIK